jgi:hypothetical protein
MPRQVPVSPDCVFDASLVPGTCPERFLDLKGLINKVLESRPVFTDDFREGGSQVSDSSPDKRASIGKVEIGAKPLVRLPDSPGVDSPCG